jgi:DNA-binding transcriptional LysR family regulator
MEMHQVRYFLSVARTLNFTAAAEECHVAQPSLSRAIIKLEQELGGDLFRRERSLTHLTDLGRLMLPLLTQCYDSANAAKSLASSYRQGTSAPLCLALSHTVNLQLLIHPLTELVKAFPGLELKFQRGKAGEVADALKQGEAELGIACPLTEPWDRLESWVLFTERFELAVPKLHPLAMQNSLTLASIGKHRLLPRGYCEQAGDLARILEAQGLAQDFHDTIASDHDLTALLAANIGLSIMPPSATGSDSLRTLPLADLELTRPVVLYAVAGRQRSPAATALLRLLRTADWPAILERGAPQSQAVATARRQTSTALRRG